MRGDPANGGSSIMLADLAAIIPVTGQAHFPSSRSDSRSQIPPSSHLTY
jgi:hypothetical protein